MTKTKQPLLRLENISKYYNNRRILENVSFEVLEGEILAILGLSGCGKSTLLKVLCGFVMQDKGRVIYERKHKKSLKIVSEAGMIRSLFGFSSQEPSFYPSLTVFENLMYFGTLLNLKGIDLYERIEKVLQTLDISEVRSVHAGDLSEGMKKRLDIGCSILHSPKILILDEPTANLDYKLREELLSYIKKINEEGMTIIFVSHYLEEVMDVSHRVAILAKTHVKVVENHTNLKHTFAKSIE